MDDDARKKGMREAAAARREAMKEAGLVQRTVWIRSEDVAKFDLATEALTDHARIISYLIGYDLGMTPPEIMAAVKKHGLPYTYDDMRALIFRGFHSDDDSDEDDEKVEAILRKYNFPFKIERLR